MIQVDHDSSVDLAFHHLIPGTILRGPDAAKTGSDHGIQRKRHQRQDREKAHQSSDGPHPLEGGLLPETVLVPHLQFHDAIHVRPPSRYGSLPTIQLGFPACTL